MAVGELFNTLSIINLMDVFGNGQRGLSTLKKEIELFKPAKEIIAKHERVPCDFNDPFTKNLLTFLESGFKLGAVFGFGVAKGRKYANLKAFLKWLETPEAKDLIRNIVAENTGVMDKR